MFPKPPNINTYYSTRFHYVWFAQQNMMTRLFNLNVKGTTSLIEEKSFVNNKI